MSEKDKKINSIMAYVGGKSRLRNEISGYIPKQDLPLRNRTLYHYVEPFGGAAWILLSKDRWFENEVYNDLNGDLTNLFNVIKFHPFEFYRQFKYIYNSQSYFDYFQNNEVITDIQKAIKAYYKYAFSFSSKGSTFSYESNNFNSLKKRIDDISKRFAWVIVSNRSYEYIIDRFNKKNTFMYLDPPYLGSEYFYSIPFTENDHQTLNNKLLSFKGKFILSYNNSDTIREMYKDFKIINVQYDCKSFKRNKIEKEIIIMNY